MKEKAILAYFSSPEQAKQAEKKLSSLGTIDTQIDRISRYPAEGGIEQINNPITGNITSLPGMTMDAATTSNSASVLLANDVTASGISDGGQEAIDGRDILLTAVVDESVHKRALKIVRKEGGLV
ncbi:hypothetical protein [Aneurinibacillus tyrosinisolvens]|uniref:hypothetical protein n=1 Tax=Aneurinibacillus tyrosinisolvens TaxID=1443435 RepID=UPI00063F72D7|nr:hypothetical protein [Aneurinibacillus tyrosinisolvens]